METIFSVLKTLFLGFIGLLFVLFLLALIFGKRVRKQWEYEAEFHDADGREFGEFDIERSRIEKQEADFTIKAKLRLRHASLVIHQSVQVYVDDLLVLEGKVENDGWILLGKGHLKAAPERVSAGQVCRIVVGGAELASAELVPD